MIDLIFWACVILVIFTFIAALDGVYFHLYKYKLYANGPSKKEHKLHTINSFFFPITIYLLFAENFKSIMLWLAVFFTAVSLIVEFIDVFEEKQSRANIGGLTSLEYAIHFGMATLRTAYTTLILASKPAESWSLLSPLVVSGERNPPFVTFIGYGVVLIGIPVFLLHLYLMFHKPK